MKPTIATVFIAASASATSISTSEVSASILEEHENSKGSVSAAAKKQDVECAFVDRIAVQKSADVGVLSCGVGKVCVEDSTSTVGGRCKLLASADDEAAALEPQRERELCEKCLGNNACVGVDDLSRIGCGSCIGVYACAQLASGVTIGNNACFGELACDRAYGEMNIIALMATKISQSRFVFPELKHYLLPFLSFHSQCG